MDRCTQHQFKPTLSKVMRIGYSVYIHVNLNIERGREKNITHNNVLNREQRVQILKTEFRNQHTEVNV